MHLAATLLFSDSVAVKSVDRLLFGAILTDAENGANTHYKRVTPDGLKFFDVDCFYHDYKNEILSDDLYLGYYLHLIQDSVYRFFVYEKYGWDPSVPGSAERLHNDYRLTNTYIAAKYGLKRVPPPPEGIEKERIVRAFPFIVKEFFSDMEKDFATYSEGIPFFLTPARADEYISLAVDVCKREHESLVSGSGPSYIYKWR